MRKILLGMLAVAMAATSGISQIYTQDFEAGLPDSYTAENIWQHGNDAFHNSQYFQPAGTGSYMCANDDTAGSGVDGSGKLITGEIDLTNATGGLVLTHDAYFRNLDYEGDERATIQVSEDGGATFTTIYELGAVEPFGEVKTDLSAYAGKKVVLAFEYSDGNSWNYGYCVDNIKVQAAAPRNIVLLGAETLCEVGKSSETTSGRIIIVNDGVGTLNEVTVEVAGQSETFSDLNIGAFQRAELKLENPITIESGTNNYTFIVSADSEGDGLATDNMAEVSITGIEPVEGSRVMIEEATGTWCQYCPAGAFYLDRYTECLPDNFVGVAVHNGDNDPMVVADYDAGLTAFPGFEGFPSVIVDKKDLMHPVEMGAAVVSKVTSEPMAYVTTGAEFDETSRTLTVSVAGSDFAADMEGVKFFATVVEDDVLGDDAGYAQVNAYSGAGFLIGGYELMGASVTDVPYNHVARAMLGGDFSGVNPVDAATGETQGYTFSSIQLPEDQDITKMHIVGAVLNSAGEVLNSESVSFEEAVNRGLFVSSTKEVVDANLASVFPNPTTERLNIQVELGSSESVAISIYDITGRMVFSQDFGQTIGNTTFTVDAADFNAGLYNVHVKAGDRVLTTKVSVIK